MPRVAPWKINLALVVTLCAALLGGYFQILSEAKAQGVERAAAVQADLHEHIQQEQTTHEDIKDQLKEIRRGQNRLIDHILNKRDP